MIQLNLYCKTMSEKQIKRFIRASSQNLGQDVEEIILNYYFQMIHYEKFSICLRLPYHAPLKCIYYLPLSEYSHHDHYDCHNRIDALCPVKKAIVLRYIYTLWDVFEG